MASYSSAKPSNASAVGGASITMMAKVHLLHDQPSCPFDDTPITFTSMPNPRRKARYRLSCFYCGRHAELNWPPPEAKM